MTTPVQYEKPPFELFSVDDDDAGRGICLYARGGLGKTSLLLSLKPIGPGLVIDVPQMEGGTEVLKGAADWIRRAKATTWNDLDEIYKYLERGRHPFRWCAIDSVTGTSELASRKAIKERDLSADPYQKDLRDYGKIGSLQSELFWKYRSLPIHTIFIAQERIHKGEGGEDNMMGPDVTPAALGALLPSMKLVARLRYEFDMMGGVERRLMIGPSQRSYTKYRAAPGVVVPSTIRIPNPKDSTLLSDLIRFLDGESVELDIPEETSGIVLVG